MQEPHNEHSEFQPRVYRGAACLNIPPNIQRPWIWDWKGLWSHQVHLLLLEMSTKEDVQEAGRELLYGCSLQKAGVHLTGITKQTFRSPFTSPNAKETISSSWTAFVMAPCRLHTSWRSWSNKHYFSPFVFQSYSLVMIHSLRRKWKSAAVDFLAREKYSLWSKKIQQEQKWAEQ